MAAPTEQAAHLVRRLRGTAVPAVLTPMRADRVLDVAALERYAEAITSSRIGGVAVWAHTGRGPYLTSDERRTVIATFRSCTEKPVVAGVAAPYGTDAGEQADGLIGVAEDAASSGADVVLVFPPRAFADRSDREAAVLDLHVRVAERIGLPMMLFVLHAAAGGYPYSLPLLRDLLAIPHVLGVKIATLDSAMTCQDVTHLVAHDFPDRLAVTGEDRMFGPSLMWGAQAALVGLAAARCDLTVDLIESWCSGNGSAFVEACARVDRFAKVTFVDPIEGYVQRMLWAAEAEGIIPSDAAYDPFGPGVSAAERERVHAIVRSLRPNLDVG